MTRLTFAQAINAALRQAMELDPGVFVYGIGADGKAGIFGTTTGLVESFGAERVFDTPIAEGGLAALAAGAASSGLRPVLVHQRLDFMLYSVDQVVNWMAPWRFMSGGRAKMPVTIRAIIGKGWGQGPQHTKSSALLVRARSRPAGRHARVAGRCEGSAALEHHERRSDPVHRGPLALHHAGGGSRRALFHPPG